MNRAFKTLAQAFAGLVNYGDPVLAFQYSDEPLICCGADDNYGQGALYFVRVQCEFEGVNFGTASDDCSRDVQVSHLGKGVLNAVSDDDMVVHFRQQTKQVVSRAFFQSQ